jgi:hypothetical protein
MIDMRAPVDDSRGRGMAAQPEDGSALWGAMAGPPPPHWAAADGSGGGGGGMGEFGFALACDRTVALHDLRRPAHPVLSWLHRLPATPAWLQMAPTAPWRASSWSNGGYFSVPGGSGEGGGGYGGGGGGSGGMIIAAAPHTGDVLAFEFADGKQSVGDGGLLCTGVTSALSGGVRVPLPGLTAGTPARVPLPQLKVAPGHTEDERWTDMGAGAPAIQGVVLVPPPPASSERAAREGRATGRASLVLHATS